MSLEGIIYVKLDLVYTKYYSMLGSSARRDA
jgi:hypothetical protein